MDQFRIPVHGKAQERCTYVFGNVRVSALTDRLLRVEYSKSGIFCDDATQVVWNRNFSSPDFNTIESKGQLHVSTGAVTWSINGRGRVVSMETCNGRKLTLRGNLKGTRRTLDFTFGAVKLGDGLMARGGAAVMDDSKSLLLDKHSQISPRAKQEDDRYYFCYGNDYKACLRDFYQLTGAPPAIPRWALGNWWSRYKAYTQQEYLGLMERFQCENMPITVATVDMDWHWVDLSRFDALAKTERGMNRTRFWGSGWTGYSWNTDLFPDWHGFLNRLHEMNLRVPLNLHPADGVRAFEDAYEDVAKAMGIDPASGQQIPFDLRDPKFRKAYFEQLHHPLEDAGVDFWWIDWQQGKRFPTVNQRPSGNKLSSGNQSPAAKQDEALAELDPLWALNHYHYLDNARKGGGLILSRFAGPGSHRYPLGFSGDATINWAVLRFQPYFTANAANVGYGWWSHDIGGHHMGKKDDELYLRWLQFGVFSPINRLHSTSNLFAGKEPWLTNGSVYHEAGKLLRLRHRLIPYLYTMAQRAAGWGEDAGMPLCQPLYYAWPDEPQAYRYRSTYLFGSELLVAPISEKTDPLSHRAGVTLWMPPGRWTDIFTGQIYEGGRVYTVYRGQEQMPVFAKAGAILPLGPEPEDNDSEVPETLCVEIWRGNNTFTLYEDEGETTFALAEEDGSLRLHIAGYRPRNYTIRFRDIVGCEDFFIDGKEQAFTNEVVLHDTENCTLLLQRTAHLRNKDTVEALTERISSFQLGTNALMMTYGRWIKNPVGRRIPGKRRLRGCLQEIMDLHQ